MTDRNAAGSINNAGAGDPQSHFARIVADLGAAAQRFEHIDVGTDGLADRLPAMVPVVIDRRTGAFLSLREELERWRLLPERKTGTARAETLDSFIDLVNRHKLPESAIFARLDWKKPQLRAVINYHMASSAGGNGAQWCDHTIVYDFPIDETWKIWVEANGKAMGQSDFAAFLEDHIAELASPTDAERIDLERRFDTKIATPSEVMSLSRGLAVTVGANVKNAVTLQSGEGEVSFVEEHRDARGEKIRVPGLFLLNIPPFFRGESVRVPVRLRYRVREGAIVWVFQMWRPDRLIDERIGDDIIAVQNKTSLPVYAGAPESRAGAA